ncbi:MAG: DNA primase [Chlamydiae bacterium SM23_39]|nr:MAG: DNA primase [Chlamydiae bacterium SM23_39]
MKIFSKESLENLKQNIDLVEIVSSYVDLKKSGAFFKGLCPFHNEKTPSFIIQRGDSHYHCFGCGAHGDAIEFLMSFQKLSFMEAVEMLADRFNVVLEEKKGEFHSNKNILKETLFKAMQFFYFMLIHTKEGKEALCYLYKRGITLDFIKTFYIGYAPKSYLFQKAMKEQNVRMDLLEEAGLIKNLNGKKIDFFSDRIMIPIKDKNEDVIGFSARKYKEDSFGPKYINTPDTSLFKKSYVLFGLSYSRKKIIKEKRAIIVEGQFDALRLIYEGISIAVAGQGTAFGEVHAKELLKLGVNKIYLALDGDKAGREASIKIGEIFQRVSVEVFVVSIDDEKDPDTYIKEKGPEKFIALLKNAKDYLKFLVDERFKEINIDSPAAKNRVVKSISEMIKSWEDPLMVHESLKKLSSLSNIPISVIENDMDNPNFYIKKSESVHVENVDPDRVIEKDLLRWLILLGDGSRFFDIIKLNLKEEDLKIDLSKRLFKKCLEIFKKEKKIDILSLAMNLEDTEEQLFLSEILQKKVNREKAELGFLESLNKLLERNWIEERENIRKEIQKGNLDEKEVLMLAKRFDDIKNKKPKIIFPNQGSLENF